MLTKEEQIIVKAARRAPVIEIRLADSISSGYHRFEHDGQFCKEIADAIYGYLNRQHLNKV